MDTIEEQPLGQIPDDWWRLLDASRILTEWFKRHLLALFISVRVGEEIRYAVYSGFMLQFNQKLLWITVGHVIEELNDILLNHRDDILQMRWLDNCPIPGAETFHVHNRDLKLFWSNEIDFGFGPITGLDEANIRNNKQVQILSEQGWRNIHRARPEGFYIIGYPKEWMQIKLPGGKGQTMGTATINLSCLPIQRVPFKQDGGSFWKDPEGFYGKIMPFNDHGSAQPSSPVGMSGAPVISLERGLDENGEMRIRYYLFGIQRSWNEIDTIRAEPIEKVARTMSNTFKHWKSDVERRKRHCVAAPRRLT